MADTKRADFLEHRGFENNQTEIVDRIPTRLNEDLAATTVIAASGTATEKVRVKGASKIRVRAKLTGTTPNGTLSILPLLADEATEAATGTGTGAISASGTEIMVDLDLKGEKEVNITVSEDGGANALTVSYIDVYLF